MTWDLKYIMRAYKKRVVTKNSSVALLLMAKTRMLTNLKKRLINNYKTFEVNVVMDVTSH
jgi:hypothetical protein